jgi:BON domain
MVRASTPARDFAASEAIVPLSVTMWLVVSTSIAVFCNSSSPEKRALTRVVTDASLALSLTLPKTVEVLSGQGLKDTTKTAADKTKEGAAKTGEVITDAWITTKIQGRLSEKICTKAATSTSIPRTVVTLTGTVKSAAGRARAAEIAKTTDGVTRVIDQLVIK